MKMLLAILSTLLLFGCASRVDLAYPEAKMVSDETVASLHEPYIKKFSTTKQSYIAKVEWVQPINRNEPCLIYSSVDVNEEYLSFRNNFHAMWDGECRDGYAYGLGLEFVYYDDVEGFALAEYSGGKTTPMYYTHKYSNDNYTWQGDINADLTIRYSIDKSGENDITIGSIYNEYPVYNMQIDTKNAQIVLHKIYPELSYHIIHDVYPGSTQMYMIMDNHNYEMNAIASYTNYGTVVYSFSSDMNYGGVNLPKSFHDTMFEVAHEVLTVAEKAINASMLAHRKQIEYLGQPLVDIYEQFHENVNFKGDIKSFYKLLDMSVNENYPSDVQALQKETIKLYEQAIKSLIGE